MSTTNAIHEPAAAGSSGTITTDLENLSALELMAEKDKVEAELKALGQVLESHGVNMNTSLTTFDGFPRDDIDIAQIRTTRARIIYLRNDWKNLMDHIEKALHVHFANQNGSAATSPSSEPQASRRIGGEALLGMNGVTELAQEARAFAKVNSIVTGSPADQAGLLAGDEIVKFGDVNWLNHERLTRIPRYVQSHEGHKIQVVVNRAGAAGAKDEVKVDMIPMSGWGGRGLLGCHLLPM